MEKELRKPQYEEAPAPSSPWKAKRPPNRSPPHPLDICEISATAFHLNLRRKETELFSVSLYEIDRELESRGLADDSDNLQEVRRKLPQQYRTYEDVFSKAASDELPPHRSYDHKIELDASASLSYGPLYSQTTDELRAMKDYLTENLDKGFIEASQAPWSSPVLFVKKPDGRLRFCIDFRKLNLLTRKDRYPLPLIDETLARLNRAKVYTKLDIRQAFHRIRIHPDSEELTTFRTRYGSYKCKVLPFGLTNGPATYQRYMNDILFEYLDVFCTAYLDDILIYSEDPLEHETHVKKVLERLRAAGLQADIKKCEFSVTRTKYLGFIVSTSGLEVDPEKVAIVKDWQAPRSVKGVQSFLGFCNFYRRFIPNCGKIAKPLTRLTHIGVEFDFDDACQSAFERLKSCLIEAPVLAHYDPTRQSRLETDASDGVVAGVLSQLGDDRFWHPVAFFSKTMAPAELNYEIHDKEMLAIVRSLSQWRAELQGAPHRLEIYTDHKALEYFMSSKNLTARQARWSEILSQFFFQIMYRPGRKNELADALSRREQDLDPQAAVKEQLRHRPLLTTEQLSPEVVQDLEIAFLEPATLIDNILRHNREHSSLDALRRQAQSKAPEEYTLKDGLLLYEERVVVPDVDHERTKLIQEAHGQISSAHPGERKTYQLLKPRYYWHGMWSDIKQYIRNCRACRESHHYHDKTPGLYHPLPVPEHPWQHICVDFKSFPADKDGFDNICVFVDRLSKAAVSIPCKKTITAKEMAELYYVYVYRYYDLPDSIVSDRGPQFVSDFWNALCAILGVKVKLSTANSPQTDGQTENLNQYIDQRLRPFVDHYQSNWSSMLPALDNAQLTLPHDTIGTSPFYLSRGYSPRRSFDWEAPKPATTVKEKLALAEAEAFAKRLQSGWDTAKKIMGASQERKARIVNKTRREPDFSVKDKVWLSTKHLALGRPSRKLAKLNDGPYTILEQKGHSYRLDLPKHMKIHPVIHARFLRKDPNDPLPGQVNPPPTPLIVGGEEEWEVERLLAVRKRYGKLVYKVKWLGADEDLEEYLAENFKYSPYMLRDFHLTHPDLPSPPKNLDK